MSSKFKEMFREKNKNIIVRFDEIFSNEEFKKYNTFVMGVGKKRVYSMQARSMCGANNKILMYNDDVSEHFITSFFAVKKAIDDGMFTKIDTEDDVKKAGSDVKRDFGKYVAFIDFMVSTMFTRRFIDTVKEYVDKHYKEDSKDTSRKINSEDEIDITKFNPGMTFTKDQLKMLLVVSVMSRFAVPLCTHYIYVNSDEHIKVFGFIHTVLDALFKIVVVGTDTKSIIDKLYTFVGSHVKSTEPANKLIWEKFPMYNETKESIIEDLVEKIITTILPKFEMVNPIRFISVVARDSIRKFKIRAKNPYDCYRISDSDNSSNDEDKLSESDIFDKYYRVIDMNITVLNRYANDDAIEVICRRYNTRIDEDEYQFYLKNYELHNATVLIVSNVFARFFSGVANVRSCTFEQFIKLVIILVHKMKDMNINHLPSFITAKRESYSFTKMPSSTVLKELKSNVDYNALIDNKYHYIHSVFEIRTGVLEDKNPIIDLITSLIHNNYLVCEYGNKNNGDVLDVPERLVMNDVIQLYRKMII